MKILATLLLVTLVSLVSCGDAFTTYEVKDLYGEWKGEPWSFTFKEDGSCKIINKGQVWPGETTWRAVSIGNTLELVADGKVIMSNLTVKSIANDTLQLETRPMIGGARADVSTVLHTLVRVQ